MKKISSAILAACILTFGNLAAHSQSWVNCSGNSSNNDCLGWDVLPASSGSSNAVFGNESMPINTTGAYNATLGAGALNRNTTGDDNTAVGYESLYTTQTGYYNTAVGAQALYNADSASNNTAVGYGALYSDYGGAQNTAVGLNSGATITSGSENTIIGYEAGDSTTTAVGNIDIGYEAGYYNTTGFYNIDIGNTGMSTDSDTIRIGANGTHTAFYAAGINGASVGSGGLEVYINSSGQLGTVLSSIRFKEDVHDMGDVSSAIFRLRPVTYRYKEAYANGPQTIDYGLIAEEVAKVYPDMVVKGADGQILTVQYQKLTPLMLNELQKEHQLLEDQQAKIQQLEKQLAALPSLEQRLTALEAAQPSSARLEARLTTK